MKTPSGLCLDWHHAFVEATHVEIPRFECPSHLEEKSTARNRFSIYVEPVSAPGVRTLLADLKRLVKADVPKRKEGRYSRLAGGGLHGRLLGPVYDENDGLQDYYRLFLSCNLGPIGYCTFFWLLTQEPRLSFEIEEVWIAPRYRNRGLGGALAEKVAEIAHQCLQALDQRFHATGYGNATLSVEVVGDVVSYSGSDFIFNVRSALQRRVDITRWLTFPEPVKIAADPRF